MAQFIVTSYPSIASPSDITARQRHRKNILISGAAKKKRRQEMPYGPIRLRSFLSVMKEIQADVQNPAFANVRVSFLKHSGTTDAPTSNFSLT
jgi:hypothetical protein